MALLDQIQTAMFEAMKARDEVRLGAIRMIKTALARQRVDGGKALDAAAEMQVLKSLAKQRQESAGLFRKGGRPELAEREDAELRIIESFLPAPAAEEEMDAAVAAALAETGAASIKQLGAVMKAAQARLAGKLVDGKALSDKVRAKLA